MALLSTAFFGIVTAVRGEMILPNRECIRDILIAAILIGVVYYGLTFIGIRYSTPGNTAIVSLSEILFAYLLIGLLLKHEAVHREHVLGSLLMIFGCALILVPKSSGWHVGDGIILLASMFPSLGNMAMQRARKHVSAAFIMLWRSLIGGVFLAILAFTFEPVPNFSDVVKVLPSIVFGGIMLLGLSKILWIEAIHRMPITRTLSIAAIQPLLTMLFSFLLLAQKPTLAQCMSFLPMALGLLFLVRSPSLRQESSEAV